jgi:hypothetical protein
VKFRAEGLLGDIDLAALAFLALSAPSEEDASRSGPVPSTDVSIPSSEPSTPAGDTEPTPADWIDRTPDGDE